MIAITGFGKDLRLLMKEKEKYRLGGAIWFPETMLDANEQASFFENLKDKNVKVVTLSPWIISDADSILWVRRFHRGFEIKKWQEFSLKGASCNQVTMKLWRGITVSSVTHTAIKHAQSVNELVALKIGDSVEKVLKMNFLMDVEDGKNKKK